jgi:hypothetical protein
LEELKEHWMGCSWYLHIIDHQGPRWERLGD